MSTTRLVAFVRCVRNWTLAGRIERMRRRRKSLNRLFPAEVLEYRALLSAGPVVSGLGGTVTYTAGNGQLLFAPHIVLSDSQSTHLTSATISFTNWQDGDRVEFQDPSPLHWTFTKDLAAHTAVLTISGSATVAAYQTELRSLGFFSVASNPPTVTRVANVKVSDGISNSNVASESIQVAAAAAPVLSGLGGTATYNPGGSAVKFATGVSVSEASGSTISGATISFTNWQDGDRVEFSGNFGLNFTFTKNLTTHTAVLQLSGDASAAVYQAELRSLGFFNVLSSPSTATRTATIQVNNGGTASNSVTENIAVT